jgi:hypothetical protein
VVSGERKTIRTSMAATRFFLGLGLVALSIGTVRATVREFEKTFAVQPSCSVKVDTYRGSITVAESDQAEVRVLLQMSIRSDDPEEAGRIFAALQLEALDQENTILLRARNPQETRVRFVWNDKNQIDLEWRISVPRQSNVEAVTRNGGITVGNLEGRVVARTEKGTISIKRIEGSIEASAEVGDVVISRCSGPVKVRVLQGTVRVGSIGGLADVKNLSGDVSVQAARAGITASAEAGDVYVGFPFDSVGDARVSTAGGSIHVTVAPSLNCRVNASSVWGRVENLLPMAIQSGGDGKSKLAGQIGVGGPQLTFSANGGHVKIVPGDSFIE